MTESAEKQDGIIAIVRKMLFDELPRHDGGPGTGGRHQAINIHYNCASQQEAVAFAAATLFALYAPHTDRLAGQIENLRSIVKKGARITRNLNPERPFTVNMSIPVDHLPNWKEAGSEEQRRQNMKNCCGPALEQFLHSLCLPGETEPKAFNRLRPLLAQHKLPAFNANPITPGQHLYIAMLTELQEAFAIYYGALFESDDKRARAVYHRYEEDPDGMRLLEDRFLPPHRKPRQRPSEVKNYPVRTIEPPAENKPEPKLFSATIKASADTAPLSEISLLVNGKEAPPIELPVLAVCDREPEAFRKFKTEYTLLSQDMPASLTALLANLPNGVSPDMQPTAEALKQGIIQTWAALSEIQPIPQERIYAEKLRALLTSPDTLLRASEALGHALSDTHPHSITNAMFAKSRALQDKLSKKHDPGNRASLLRHLYVIQAELKTLTDHAPRFVDASMHTLEDHPWATFLLTAATGSTSDLRIAAATLASNPEEHAHDLLPSPRSVMEKALGGRNPG